MNLMTLISEKDHPMSRFTIGDKKTLKKKGGNFINALIYFQLVKL
jgi:secreted Zn-dependent insulinase-like peptidase